MTALVAAYLRKTAVKPALVSCSCTLKILFRHSSHHLDRSSLRGVCQHINNNTSRKNNVILKRKFADNAKGSTKEAQTSEEAKKGSGAFETLGSIAILYQIWKHFIREKDFSEDEDAFMERFIQRNKRVSDQQANQVQVQQNLDTKDHDLKESPLGVSVHHLCQEFRKNARESVISKNNQHQQNTKWGWPFRSRKVALLKPDDANVYHIVNDVIKKRGEDITCPVDGRKGTAYVNCLKGEDHVGKANIMLSYAWGNKINDICNALEDHCHENGLDPKRTYIWICCLCNNQHRFDDIVPFDELKETFRTKVEGIGNVIPLFAPWDAPNYTVSSDIK